MRQSFRRAGLLVMAVLLAFAAAIAFAGPASAVKLKNELVRPAVTQVCADPRCPQDTVTIPTGTVVDTYCVLGNYNVTYTGPSTGRGGFVRVSAFRTPGLQFAPCDDSGLFGQVGGAETNLCLSADPCVNIGRVAPNAVLRAFCELGTAPNRWFLVFVDTTGLAGFVSERALQVVPGVPSCDSPF
jgi:hypothetical protein